MSKKKPLPKTAIKPTESIQKAADNVVLIAGIAAIEANQRFLASRISLLEQTLNEFLDMTVSEFEKSIGGNFAAPFKAHLKKLSERYDNLQSPSEVLDNSVKAVEKARTQE